LKNLLLIFVLVVIVSLNAIIFWGAGAAGGIVGSNVIFGILVMVMDVSLVISSSWLGFLFLRARRIVWASLFFANLLAMAIALIFKLNGISLSSFVLFGADLYWLNLYLVCLCREWQNLKSRPNGLALSSTAINKFSP
jgi:hypothetical protein